MRFERFEHRHMTVHVLVTDKFKTTTMVLNLQRPLLAGQVTRSALIPQVLMRGSAGYPSVREIQRQLDNLYGSHMGADVYKLGERHVLQFRLEVPNGRYLPGRPKLLREGLSFLNEVLTNPAREGVTLKPAFVALEKESLRKRVEGLFNNKMQYATLRCIDAMCPTEPYHLYSGGRIEDLADITPETLTADYEELLATAPMDLFVVGDVDPNEVRAAVTELFALPERRVAPLPPTSVLAGGESPRFVVDRFDVNQGQLVMGFRVPITYADDDYFAMMAYNGVLGGFAHSKLFMNVRERESLAYSARSRYEAHKGLLLVQVGIDLENYDRALAVIQEQFAALAAGDITDTELAQTHAMLVNTYREAYDSPGALINLAFESRVAGRDRSIEDLVASVPTITREDLVRVSRAVKLDTVYFLRDKERVESHA